MIHVLGFTDADARLPANVLHETQGLGVVTAPVSQSGSARERLSLQVAHAADLDAFVPVSPAVPVSLGELKRWIPPRVEIASRLLEDVRGKVQLTVELTIPDEERPAGAELWLRQRANIRTRRMRILEAVAARCTGLGASSVRTEPGRSRLHLLLRRADFTKFPAALRDADFRGLGPLRERLSASATGPWPVLAFVDGEWSHGCR